MRLYIVTVSELVPQYKHWHWFSRFWVFFGLFIFSEHCRQRFPGVPAEHVITMQTVVETNILKS